MQWCAVLRYLPIAGYKPFVNSAVKLALGDDNPAITEGRVAAIQSLSGTGACRVMAEFMQRYMPGERSTSAAELIHTVTCIFREQFGMLRRLWCSVIVRQSALPAQVQRSSSATPHGPTTTISSGTQVYPSHSPILLLRSDPGAAITMCNEAKVASECSIETGIHACHRCGAGAVQVLQA